MHMLQAGVPFNVIALYLGHETPATTHRYAEANLAMKEQALARLEEPPVLGTLQQVLDLSLGAKGQGSELCLRSCLGVYGLCSGVRPLVSV